MKKNSKHSQQNKDVHSRCFYSNIVLDVLVISINQSIKEIKGVQIKGKLSQRANDVILYRDTRKLPQSW